MPSTTVPIRLNERELAMLDAMRNSPTLGHLNRSEWIRRMIVAEHNRRLGKTAPGPSQYQSELRNGRPRRTEGKGIGQVLAERADLEEARQNEAA